jgi:glycerate dehydrogenase
MKLVVLDGYTMNPGDLSWDDLGSLGELTVYDRTPPELTVERAQDAEAVFTNKVILGSEQIRQLPKLRYIGVLATGTNVVDLPAATARRIVVTNVPAYSTESVVQMVFAHLLNLSFGYTRHTQGVRDGRWQQSPDFCYWDQPLIELSGRILGIIGFGRIGLAVALAARGFGLQVFVNAHSIPRYVPNEVRLVSLEEIFRSSDIVSLHCPLTHETRQIVNLKHISMMKRSAWLINTGRGPLVDEKALADALNSGRIAGAGLDVLSTEPPQPDNPLLSAKNCFITPHIAWATVQSRQRLMRTVVANHRAFQEGRPLNVVRE